MKNGIQIPQCIICFKTLTNESMKPSKLREHFFKMHPDLVDKGVDYLKLNSEGLLRAKLDASGTFQQESNKFVEASYYISLQIAKNKKPHTIGEDLIKPCLLETARLVLNEGSYNKINEISLSNNTVQRRIKEIAIDIKDQVIEKIHAFHFFSIQLDESSDVAQCSQLMVFARYVIGILSSKTFSLVVHWRQRQRQTMLWPICPVSLKKQIFVGTSLSVYVPTEHLPCLVHDLDLLLK